MYQETENRKQIFPRPYSVVHSQRGLTLIEILLALAIVGIVSAVGMSALSNANKNQALTLESEKVLSLLSRARSETLAAKDSSAFGVHFETSKAVLFKGPTYGAGASGNDIQALSDLVTISSISLSGGTSDVVFQKLTGAASASGTIRLSLLSNASASTTITIAPTGAAYNN